MPTNAQEKYQAQLESGRVAVIYHYFAHYRQGIVRELIENGEFHYEFFGDTRSHGSGIELASEFPDHRFARVKGYQVGPLFLQPSVLAIATSREYNTLILLGNAKWPTTWLAALLGRITGKRVLFWTHGWLANEGGLQRVVRNTFYRLAHALLVYGRRAKLIGVRHMGFSPEKIYVVYNSLDTKAQDDIRSAVTANDIQHTLAELFPGRERIPVVINVTRLNARKRLDMLFDAAAKLRDEGIDVNLLIVGDGEQRAELEARGKSLELHCVFMGSIYEEREIARMTMGAKVTVMPGPIGLTAMQSLAYGTPVITNDDFDSQMPECEAIVKGVSGDFFTAGDVDDLARTMKKWIKPATVNDRSTVAARAPIERFYNPRSQREIIDDAVRGDSPDDRDLCDESCSIWG